MCDCYTAKCDTCDNQIEVHIADFSCKRSQVIVLCPQCVRKYWDNHPNPSRGRWAYKARGIRVVSVFPDTVEAKYQICNSMGREIGRPGEVVLFLCLSKRGYGIHLN